MFASILIWRGYEVRKVIIIFAAEKMFCEVVCFLIEYVFYRPTGLGYYGAMASFDFITILLIYIYCKSTNLSMNLQRICFVSIIVNSIAWICWEYYIAHAYIYNKTYIVLYIIALILMIKKDNDYDGNRRSVIWSGAIRWLDISRLDNNTEDTTETRK